jgi:hydrogenase expression/formation protein HypD
MEICGGQTHSIIKNGIDQVLSKEIELVHGPGCPVCVTPLEMIDKALAIASQKEVIFTCFGDMLRVPGTQKDLSIVKSEGADVRIVYSPLEALTLAKENSDKEVVFFAVGFETTAPGNAMALFQASQQGVKNFSLLVSHVLVPPAIEALLSSEHNRIQAYLAPGHVCTVMGWEEYIPISKKYKVPVVVTGFEPIDILEGIYLCINQLEESQYKVENQYVRSVKQEGNKAAQNIMNKVFEKTDQKWRGIGVIPQSGLKIRKELEAFDAALKFHVYHIITEESDRCISGLILQGLKKPFQCPSFGTECTPLKPLGATMVSSEGACSAYFKYQRKPGDLP